MAFRDAITPADSDLLCESCGYILNGLELTPDGHCPECGEPLATSLDPTARGLAPIEVAWTTGNFWRTTLRILFRKRQFFRETITRRDSERVRSFGMLHRVIAGILFGVAAATHLAFMAEMRLWAQRWTVIELLVITAFGAFFAISSVAILFGVTRLATVMTAAESRFWGMRLPKAVLTRTMDFHAANYLPVAIVAIFITVGYRVAILADWLDARSGVAYLVALCFAVVGGAVWLFESFVIAMRRIRYANF